MNNSKLNMEFIADRNRPNFNELLKSLQFSSEESLTKLLDKLEEENKFQDTILTLGACDNDSTGYQTILGAVTFYRQNILNSLKTDDGRVTRTLGPFKNLDSTQTHDFCKLMLQKINILLERLANYPLIKKELLLGIVNGHSPINQAIADNDIELIELLLDHADKEKMLNEMLKLFRSGDDGYEDLPLINCFNNVPNRTQSYETILKRITILELARLAFDSKAARILCRVISYSENTLIITNTLDKAFNDKPMLEAMLLNKINPVLHCAIQYNRKDAITLLLNYAKEHDLLEQILELKNESGLTAIEFAVKQNKGEYVNIIKTFSENHIGQQKLLDTVAHTLIKNLKDNQYFNTALDTLLAAQRCIASKFSLIINLFKATTGIINTIIENFINPPLR